MRNKDLSFLLLVVGEWRKVNTKIGRKKQNSKIIRNKIKV